MPPAVRVVHPTPDVARGVEYWEGVPATVDGVLGGYGNGTLPRIDALGSRAFLLRVLPSLSSTPPVAYNGSPDEWRSERIKERGGKGMCVIRALDCGAGVGRVTEHSLLPLVDEVHLVEPVAKFLDEAKRCSPAWAPLKSSVADSPFYARKGVHFHVSTLQDFDLTRPVDTLPPTWMADETPEPTSELPLVYDVVWCQWCLQHLSEADLKKFLRGAQAALRPAGPNYEGGVIVVKENICREQVDGSESSWYDDEDHSVTRSQRAFERIFAESGVSIVRSEVQNGFPDELFPVMMWALR
ncbi:protein N-terminal methyltransferase [Malassezia cuniculi]|uniref:Alpha N-terminal protein methyltransferase 1 n=1 Tax=Malassezia cuniculi TaxID=948313 RepID=A0AAF0EQG7_9BASI|nr:protein N-terminal methyltransferase [Malassezia cuniculi]